MFDEKIVVKWLENSGTAQWWMKTENVMILILEEKGESVCLWGLEKERERDRKREADRETYKDLELMEEWRKHGSEKLYFLKKFYKGCLSESLALK